MKCKDIQVGDVIQLSENGAFSDCVVLGKNYDSRLGIWHLDVARPYAFADRRHRTSSPAGVLLSVELFTICRDGSMTTDFYERELKVLDGQQVIS